MPEEITVRAEAADSLIAVRLVDAMVTEMDQLYGQPPGGGVGSGASPSDFTPPTGAFLVIYAGGKPVAGGGSSGRRRRGRDQAHVRRARGAAPGPGRRLLEALEDRARELGVRAYPARHRRAAAACAGLYERAGYHRSTTNNGNSMASFWGEKILR
jgi:hypothetical protein